MKYTITINQLAVVRAGLPLDYKDCAIIDYCQAFAHSRKVKKKYLDGRMYYWFKYSHLIAEMPLLGIKKATSIWRRFKKLCDLGILIAHPDNQKANTSYYAFGDTYDKIISSDQDEPISQMQEVAPEPISQMQYNNSTITDNNTKSKSHCGSDEPPAVKKGATRKRDGLHHRVIDIFCGYYKSIKGSDFYFGSTESEKGRNGKTFKEIIIGLKVKMGGEPSDDEMCLKFEEMLRAIKDKWILENLTAGVVLSKINEIYDHCQSQNPPANPNITGIEADKKASGQNPMIDIQKAQGIAPNGYYRRTDELLYEHWVNGIRGGATSVKDFDYFLQDPDFSEPIYGKTGTILTSQDILIHNKQ